MAKITQIFLLIFCLLLFSCQKEKKLKLGAERTESYLVLLKEKKVEINLKGLGKNKEHGFHIHEAGNLLDGCGSCKAHFNPYKKDHGGPKSKERHIGDLGNIITDSKGEANYFFMMIIL